MPEHILAKLIFNTWSVWTLCGPAGAGVAASSMALTMPPAAGVGKGAVCGAAWHSPLRGASTSKLSNHARNT